MNIDYFISYCHLERHLAAQLHDALIRRGKKGWWDEALATEPGDWRTKVAENICNARTVLVIFSKLSAAREEVQKEMQFALQFAKVPLIPLIVGDLHQILAADPAARPAVLQIANLQRVDLKEGTAITEEIADQCALMLDKIGRNGAAETLPREAVNISVSFLEPLVIHDGDIPGLGGQHRGVVTACYKHFAECVKGKNWQEATELLKEMGRRKLAVLDLPNLEGWVGWASWYDRTSQSCLTSWGDLVRELEKPDAPRVKSPEDLRRTCSVVASQLEAQWWVALDKDIERFVQCLNIFGPNKEGSYAYALDCLEVLHPETLRHLEALLASVKGLPSLKEGGLRRFAEQLVRTMDAIPDEAMPECEEWHQTCHPPMGASLQKLKAICKDRSQQVEAIERFIEQLQLILDRMPGGDDSRRTGTRQLLDYLEALHKVGSGNASSFDFDGLFRAVDCWDDSLATLAANGFPAELRGEALDSALKGLDEAGKVFPAASHHAACVRGCSAQRARYETFREALRHEEDWPQSAEPLTAYLAACADLSRDVSTPWEQHLTASAGGEGLEDRLDRVRRWCRRLEEVRQALTRAHRIFTALSHLRTAGSGAAVSELQAVASDAAAGTEAQEWFSLCQAVQEIEAEWGRAWPSLCAGAVDASCTQELLEMPKPEFHRRQTYAAEAVRALHRTRKRSALCRGFALPGLERAAVVLETVGRCRTHWQRARQALADLDVIPARQALEELARHLPAVGSALAALTAWGEAEETCNGETLVAKGEWSHAVQVIERLQDCCRQAVSGGEFAADLLQAAVQERLTRLEEQRQLCLQALQAEQLLEQALGLLEQEDFDGALTILDTLHAPSPAATAWHRAAQALGKLRGLLEGVQP